MHPCNTTAVHDVKDEIKRDREALASLLRELGMKDTHRKSVKCCFHDDTVPSAEIKQSKNGNWYFACHFCDIADDVIALRARVEGREVGEILREIRGEGEPGERPAYSPMPKTQPEGPQEPKRVLKFDSIDALLDFYRKRRPDMVVEERNPYTDPDTGEPDIVTIRYRKEPGAKKEYIQTTPCEEGWALCGLEGESLPMFNRIGAIRASRIIVVEGEKCVRTVTELGVKGLAAVSALGGAKNGGRTDWSLLAGKEVYVWGDNDEPGAKYADAVIDRLKELEPQPSISRVRWEELSLEEGGDVADYLDTLGHKATNVDKAQALEMVLLDAEPLLFVGALEERYRLLASGTYKLLPFAHKPKLTQGTQALLPGTVTCVVSEPGAGKSFMVTEEAWRQHEAGTSVKILMLEDDKAFHEQRALAQMSGQAMLLDFQFVSENPSWASGVLQRYKGRLESFSRRCLEATGSAQRTLNEIAAWVERQAAAGVRLIIVDPVTAAATSAQPWRDDLQFLMRVKRAAEAHGCSIILTTHPRIGQNGKPGLGGLAGGAAYPRFSQCVLWLRKLKDEESIHVDTEVGTQLITYIRAITVTKARSGRKAGGSLAVELNEENLCMEEITWV